MIVCVHQNVSKCERETFYLYIHKRYTYITIRNDLTFGKIFAEMNLGFWTLLDFEYSNSMDFNASDYKSKFVDRHSLLR